MASDSCFIFSSKKLEMHHMFEIYDILIECQIEWFVWNQIEFVKEKNQIHNFYSNSDYRWVVTNIDEFCVNIRMVFMYNNLYSFAID